ncbi:MAG: preprotein translocase subunit YajC [Gammaproteobacteria bacterium]|nr:preprotein translocase subunit YajC [Gammaproteobacteria bacterium]
MSFFISEAMAEATATASATPAQPELVSLMLPIGLVVLFYFLLIRPQSKRQKEHKAMVDTIQKGEEIVTAGGLLGKITNVGENFVALEISKDVTIHIQKNSIQAIMPKGTIKDQQ